MRGGRRKSGRGFRAAEKATSGRSGKKTPKEVRAVTGYARACTALAKRLAWLLVGAMALAGLMAAGCKPEHKPEPPPPPKLGVLQVYAQLPYGSRTGVARLRARVAGPKSEEKFMSLNWAASGEDRLLPGLYTVRVVALDASGRVVAESGPQQVEIQPEKATRVALTEWKNQGVRDASPLLGMLFAVALVVALGVAWGETWAWAELVRYPWARGAVCAGVGLAVGAVVVLAEQGWQWINDYGSVSLWTVAGVVFAPAIAWLATGASLTGVRVLDAVVVGGVVGVVCISVSAGLHMLPVEGFAVDKWCGASAASGFALHALLERALS